MINTWATCYSYQHAFRIKQPTFNGSIKVTVGGKELDIRVSTLTTQYGEKVVLRILDSNAVLLKLEDTGLKKMMILMRHQLT
ncbi:MAG: ATPase, T2SS/T4P/T4SS family [Thermodesulfobacteriota bacterium]